MHLYDFLFAWLYERALLRAEASGLRAIRRRLLAGARGRTLEIGAGTGLNLEHYAGAMSLVLSDPSPLMLRLLRRKATGMGMDAEIVETAGEKLPFGSETFDTVVTTLVLCTARDPVAVVREIGRVLAPGGPLIVGASRCAKSG